jgi:hypothetical protein
MTAGRAKAPWRGWRATPSLLRMQRQLFGPRARRIGSVSDAAMWRLLHALRAAPELEPFRIWLVGSRVQSGRAESDIDLVLSSRDGLPPCDEGVERALWHCRNRGLYASNPVCIVDPCFRPDGPRTTVAPLPPRSILKGVKLLSPRLLREALAGGLEGCRPVGRFSVEYSRRAGDTNYYRKLPIGPFSDSQSPYLRPAIEVAPAGAARRPDA